MKSKITKKRALLKCHEYWFKLSRNPELKKHDVVPYCTYCCDCPACEYESQQRADKEMSYFDSCEKFCPMLPAFNYPRLEVDPNTHHCEHPDSPYVKWGNTEGYDRCFFAALIAEWALYLYNEED